MTTSPVKHTYTVVEAALMIGVSASSAYAQIDADLEGGGESKRFPIKVVRCGRRILVPAVPLRDLLGIAA